MKCRAYAKALHYKEEEFHRSPSSSNLEALISINNKLQQPDAAAGVLEFAQKHMPGDFVSWNEGGGREEERGEEWGRDIAEGSVLVCKCT